MLNSALLMALFHKPLQPSITLKFGSINFSTDINVGMGDNQSDLIPLFSGMAFCLVNYIGNLSCFSVFLYDAIVVSMVSL